MIRYVKTGIVLMAALISGNVPAALAGDVVVIVSRDAAIKSLSQEDLERIFMVKSKTLPNDQPVVPLAAPEKSDTRKRFEKAVLKKSPDQIRAYWSRMMFTGRARPPQSVASDAEIVKLVATLPGRIGYVDESALDDSVTAVFRIP